MRQATPQPQQFHQQQSRNLSQSQHPYQNQVANQQNPVNRNQQHMQGPNNQLQQSNQTNMHIPSIGKLI